MSPLRGYVVFIADPGAVCFALAPGYLLSAPPAPSRSERLWPGVLSRRLRYVAPSGLRGFYCRSRGCVLRTCPWLPSLRASGAESRLSAAPALSRCERLWPGVLSTRLRYVAPSGLRGF